MDAVLTQLAESVAQAHDLESLTRPMLELLEAVTGLESTYLTTIDADRNVQRILFSRNSRQLDIPEGLEVPWGDTLCKRALDEGRPYEDDVAARWGDSEAARNLGIRTYLSQPVRTTDGAVYGTLCAASGRQVAVPPETLNVLGMFARLIAQQVDRERLLRRAQHENTELAATARTDALTGLGNRRAMEQELSRMLAAANREGGAVQVAFIDLDGFKAINDRHGHEVGDRFLVHIAGKLAASIRPGDFVARAGGDEFIVLAPGEGHADLRERLARATAGPFRYGTCDLDYPGASVGVARSEAGEADPAGLLARADAAMYEVKKARKSERA